MHMSTTRKAKIIRILAEAQENLTREIGLLAAVEASDPNERQLLVAQGRVAGARDSVARFERELAAVR